jgi:molybdopterin synthase sulfur carrier subunit
MPTVIRYFASVREAVGVASESLELPAQLRTLGELRVWLAQRSARHAEALAPARTLRMACDQEMAGPDAELRAGAEIAFFPPVTGG